LFLDLALTIGVLGIALFAVLLDRLLNHGLARQIGSTVYSFGGIIINQVNFGVYKNLDLALHPVSYDWYIFFLDMAGSGASSSMATGKHPHTNRCHILGALLFWSPRSSSMDVFS
jgi:hypothetical protein